MLWASWSTTHASRFIFFQQAPLESYAECPMHLGLFLEFSLTEPCWMLSLEILRQAKVRLQSLGGVSQ